MGLTSSSTGRRANDTGLNLKKAQDSDLIIALAGNPNVGKSTVFNELTGLHQHTGNWPGKTVLNAQGTYIRDGINHILVDIPGAYSLLALSAEEEAARDFLCFGGANAAVIVCDATCLERNLNLVLQTLEIIPRSVVCINLLDEAERKNISLNLPLLESRLGVPVVGISARQGRGLDKLTRTVTKTAASSPTPFAVKYDDILESAVSLLTPELDELVRGKLNPRWLAFRLLEGDKKLLSSVDEFLGFEILSLPEVDSAYTSAKAVLTSAGYTETSFRDSLVSSLYASAAEICRDVVNTKNTSFTQLRIDRLLTRKSTGLPVMLALLALVFFITIVGANVPSQLLSNFFSWLEPILSDCFVSLSAPGWLQSVLIDGVYRVVTWVIAVMLPPMAIFFPLFTLLEDLGYLPRVAFNLDNAFRKCCSCGKQALTMCMGFGCNAAGVVGCRIIESPRERLIAVITNSFVPCNGRFPALVAIITMFFAGSFIGSSAVSAIFLTFIIVFGVLMTFLVSYILSKTLLRGVPSSLTLEMPPFRRPQIGKVILRSMLDRTLFVLGRAVCAAAPAGLLIWLFANVTVGGNTLLVICTDFLDPFAALLGLDGVILMAFILGLPANEIVLPIIVMAYCATGTIADYESIAALKTVLVDNGWTWLTALCTSVFFLMHWPCATTLMTVKKETQSLKWTLVSFLTPAVCGITFCFIINTAATLLGLV